MITMGLAPLIGGLAGKAFPALPTTHQPLELLVPSAWEGLWVCQSSGWLCLIQVSAVGGRLRLRAPQCPGSQNRASEFSRGALSKYPLGLGCPLPLQPSLELNCLNVLEC